MTKSLQKLVWLFCVLLLLTQSILPASAIALITIRCVGMPAASPDCVRALLPISDAPLARTQMSQMPCCRHMSSTSAMMCCHPASVPLHSASLHARACLVTITPISAERTVSLTTVRQWMLNAVPALAPPADVSVSPIPSVRSASSSHPSFDLLQCCFAHCHGLRAPPVS